MIISKNHAFTLKVVNCFHHDFNSFDRVLKALIFLSLLLSFAIAFAASPVPKNDSEPVRLQLDSVPVSQVVRVVYSEILHRPYVLSPVVLADLRPVTLRWSDTASRLPGFMSTFLAELGFSVVDRLGVDFVGQIIRPEPKPEYKKPDPVPWVYRCRYRSSSYLSDLVSPLFSQVHLTNKRGVTPDSGGSVPAAGSIGGQDVKGSAAQLIDRSSDVLVFSGQPDELEKLQSLLSILDVPDSEVTIRGQLFDVQASKADGSAFGLLASVLGQRLQIGVGATSPLDTFLRLKTSSFDAVVSALSTDSRFTTVSSPVLRVKSGSSARLNVGHSVPVLGAVTQVAGGQPVQSVEYRDSGVIFNVSPTVRADVVDLVVSQEVSDFVNTTTGVTGSPTLTKKSLQTTVAVEGSDLVVIGGLSSGSDTAASSGVPLLPKWLGSHNDGHSSGELLLVLSVTR